jgi:hypothetical protein
MRIHHGGHGGQEEKSCCPSGFNVRVLRVLRGSALMHGAFDTSVHIHAVQARLESRIDFQPGCVRCL